MTTNFRRLFSKLRIRRASFKQIKTRLTRNRVVRTVDKTFRIVKSKKKKRSPQTISKTPSVIGRPSGHTTYVRLFENKIKRYRRNIDSRDFRL